MLCTTALGGRGVAWAAETEAGPPHIPPRAAAPRGHGANTAPAGLHETNGEAKQKIAIHEVNWRRPVLRMEFR
ncbi:hypothetical protein EVAR_7717_1 [Eumeta japonica]|uniref:Uncharacterized protein n=1 Tax=Eumeta variegata TaxID=151549 RepID=A0A4C1TIQ2_EUMVA|nr:hypothetical protein EVAR_7717_1 [Eumeta japonica]